MEVMGLKIVVAGGTGFIGRRLVNAYVQNNAEVILISRSGTTKQQRGVQCIAWDQIERNLNRFEGCDAIVNLAGESINQRWTNKAKHRILHSRIEASQRIAQLVDQLMTKPKCVINGSAMSIYGASNTERFDEMSSARGSGFLEQVIEAWEAAADQIKGTRLIKLRVGLVLGKGGGSLPLMMMPYRLGVGGRVGKGTQWMSWIHVDDIVRLIQFCIDHDSIHGVVNATAPNPVTNDQFGRELGRAMRRPHYFPVPAFMLKLVLGEMSTLVLEGQQVVPRVLLDNGFEFSFPYVDEALRDIISLGE